MKPFRFFWTAHRWVGITAAIVVCNTSVTGFLLLLKKESQWIQPAEQRGSVSNRPQVEFTRVLEALRGVPEAQVSGWEDVDRLDVRPSRGILKARCRNSWEVQIDLATGDVLQVAYRRSDRIESLHDGSFYHDAVHAWVMPVFAVALVFLTCSGLFLWLDPKWRKTKRRRAAAPRRGAG